MPKQPKLERYRGKLLGGQYRWHVKANGRIVSCATEGYHNEADRERSLDITLEALIREVPASKREKVVAFIRSLA